MDPFCYSCFVVVMPSTVHCSFVVTCWEMANLLVLVYVMFSCVFVTYPYGVLGQVWYLIVSIPDLCLLTYFNEMSRFYSKLQKVSVIFLYHSVYALLSHLKKC